MASGWRRPSAGLRVISRLGLRALHPPRLVGAGTVAMALLLSGLVHRSSSDGTSRAIACRAIMRAAAQRGGRLHTLHEGVLTTAPPAQVWGRRGGPGLLRGSLDLLVGVRTACRAASRPLPNVGFGCCLQRSFCARGGHGHDGAGRGRDHRDAQAAKRRRVVQGRSALLEFTSSSLLPPPARTARQSSP